MTKSTPRVGLAGLGGFAQQHISVLSTLQDVGVCQLVAAADPFAARQNEIAQSLKSRGTVIFDTLDEMLVASELDAVFLATPLPLHMPQAVACLAAGCHVYLEKPPCATLEEYEIMNRAQISSGKDLVVGFQMQHSAAMRFTRAQIAAGSIGDVRQIWSSTRWCRTDAYYNRAAWAGKWTMNGSPVFDGPATNALAHVVQGALSLAGPNQFTVPEIHSVRGMLRRARPIESYDNAYLEVNTCNGVQVRLAFSHSSEHGDDALLKCRGTQGEIHISWNGKVTVCRTGANPVSYTFLQQPGMVAAMDFLHGAPQGSPNPSVTLRDTLPYLQAVNGARQASRGAVPFATEDIAYHEKPEGRSYYSVAGLDEQMEAFRKDFDAPPPLLASESDWLTPDQLDLQLREFTPATSQG